MATVANIPPAEAAARLGVSTQTLARWARDGKIESGFTIGGHRRYAEAELERVKRGAPQAGARGV